MISVSGKLGFYVIQFYLDFQLSNREVIIEEILLYESVGKNAKVLDQLIEGLKTLGI